MKKSNKSPSKATRGKAPAKSAGKPRASSTADILGGAGSTALRPKVPKKWARHYRHLVELRNELLVQAGRLARQASEWSPNYSMHMADAGTDSFDRDFALSMLSSDQDALYEISEAIRRIELGAFGVCEMTGKRISKSRLAAIPWARFSADSQRSLERDGTLKHRQLSAFNSLPATDTAEPEEGEDAGQDGPSKES